MRRLVLAVALAFITSIALAKMEPGQTETPPTAPSEGTPAEPEFDAVTQQIVDAVKQSGFRDVGMLSLFVLSATSANGRRVLLLVDPQTMQAIEVIDQNETASTRTRRTQSRGEGPLRRNNAKPCRIQRRVIDTAIRELGRFCKRAPGSVR
jgi:hypothetical protein